MASRSSFNDWSIATKLNVVQSIALAISFIIAITWMTKWLTQTSIEDHVKTTQQINLQTRNMIHVYDNALEKNIARIGESLQKSLPTGYTLDPSQRIAISGVDTPTLRAGSEVLNLNFRIIDHFAESSSAIATILVRSGNEFVRATTSLRKEDGARAIGTMLDHDHPAYAALLANKTFTGKATLFKRDYITHYIPMQDASGAVVGALFAGLDFTDELTTLMENIRGIKLGKSGYMFLIDIGKKPGALIVHPTLEGKTVYEVKEMDGSTFMRTIIEQKNGMMPYQNVDSTDGKASMVRKIAVFNTIEEWKWVIVSCVNEKELAENASRARFILIIGAVVLCALLFAVVFITSRQWVARPLTEAVIAMEQIAEGRLNIAIPKHGNDEVGHLLAATGTMADKMCTALSDIQKAANQLASSSERLVSTASDVASQSEQQSDSASSMAASIEEMNANIVHVSESARQANQISLDSDRISSEGAVVIQQATDSMTRIANTVRMASESVSTLGRESHAISSIVNVIGEIAEQTNLLALNAAIEAARAGEQGRGFAVVADEVRKLAERTSSSTQEISAMIRRILDGTTNAVASMEEGVRQVEEGVSYAGQAGESIASIRQSASQVTGAVTDISNMLAEQSLAVTEISRNVEKIATTSDQNSQVAKESAQCAAELKQLAELLRENISRFSI